MPQLPLAMRRFLVAASVRLNPSARSIFSISSPVMGFHRGSDFGSGGILSRFEGLDVVFIVFHQVFLGVGQRLVKAHIQ